MVILINRNEMKDLFQRYTSLTRSSSKESQKSDDDQKSLEVTSLQTILKAIDKNEFSIVNDELVKYPNLTIQASKYILVQYDKKN